MVGAHEQNLDGLTNGYLGAYAGHSNMHLWYQGTVDTVGTIWDDDGVKASDPFDPDAAGWYSDSRPSRTSSGFHYSEDVDARDQPTACPTS